ncbi:glycosyltransferase [Anaerobacillus sp. HL2]|nr:glycosyltransferase [Anaerobacillus sp. HL2]
MQNSYLESFGLAAVEALISGCDILLSKNVGSICVITSSKQTDIIYDFDNPIEVAEKIEYLLKNTNKRLLNGIERDKTSYQYAANRLLALISDLKPRRY